MIILSEFVWLGAAGVEDVITDCKTHKVVVKGEKADPLKVQERVQKKSHRQVELLSPIPKPPAEEEKKPEEKEKPKPEEKKEVVLFLIIFFSYIYLNPLILFFLFWLIRFYLYFIAASSYHSCSASSHAL